MELVLKLFLEMLESYRVTRTREIRNTIIGSRTVKTILEHERDCDLRKEEFLQAVEGAKDVITKRPKPKTRKPKTTK